MCRAMTHVAGCGWACMLSRPCILCTRHPRCAARHPCWVSSRAACGRDHGIQQGAVSDRVKAAAAPCQLGLTGRAACPDMHTRCWLTLQGRWETVRDQAACRPARSGADQQQLGRVTCGGVSLRRLRLLAELVLSGPELLAHSPVLNLQGCSR